MYRRKLLEMYFQFMFVFLFFPGWVLDDFQFSVLNFYEYFGLLI